MVAVVSPATSLYLLFFFVFDVASSEALSFNSVVKSVRGGVRFQSGRVSAIQTTKSCASQVEEKSEGSGTLTSIANLSKNIIGGGMLSLPAGMAAGGGTGAIPATGALLLAMAISTRTFSDIGKEAGAVKATSFKDLWSRTVGEKTAWVVDSSIFFMTCGACVMYKVFLGELMNSIVPGMGRTKSISSITLFALLPLTLLRNLRALRYSSIAGVIASVYATAFVLLRSLDGTYAPGGLFFKEASTGGAIAPLFSGPWMMGMGTLTLFSMLNSAFTAHPNAVVFHNDLEKKPSWNTVCAVSFGLSALFYAIVMLSGHSTFGSESQGLILNNYSSVDNLANICRMATFVSVLGGYPLLFVGFRDSFLSMMQSLVSKLTGATLFTKTGSMTWTMSTLGLLAASLGLALEFKDLTKIVALVGAVLGSLLVYILPKIGPVELKNYSFSSNLVRYVTANMSSNYLQQHKAFISIASLRKKEAGISALSRRMLMLEKSAIALFGLISGALGVSLIFLLI